MVYVILAGLLAVVITVKWFQRCPKCKSMVGPKGVPGSGQLLPNHRFKVKRICRKCGHTWEEKDRYDYDF